MKLEEKVIFLDKAASFFIPKSWECLKKNENQLEIKFPPSNYPVLGIFAESIYIPRPFSEKEKKNFILEGIDNNKPIESLDNKTFLIKYEIKTNLEILYLWKIFNFLSSNEVRTMRLALSCPNNKEAKEVVFPKLNEIQNTINSISFSEKKEATDHLAFFNYKLDKLKLKENLFWNTLKIYLPTDIKIEDNQKDSYFRVIFKSLDNFELLSEKMEILRKEEIVDSDDLVEKFIKEITRDLHLKEQKLQKSKENDYLFSFISYEKRNFKKRKLNYQVISHIWYRIKVFKKKFLIISFLFEYENENVFKGEILSKKIENIVSTAEII